MINMYLVSRIKHNVTTLLDKILLLKHLQLSQMNKHDYNRAFIFAS